MILEFLANFAALLKLKNLIKLPYKADLTGFQNMSGLNDTAKNNTKIIYPNCTKLFKIGKINSYEFDFTQNLFYF